MLVTKTLRKGVSFFSSKSNELVWWKLDKMFFNMEEDIYVALFIFLLPIQNILVKQKKTYLMSYRLKYYTTLGLVKLF